MNTDAIALSPARAKLADLFVLTKVRLNSLVVVTTAGGYYMGADAVDPIVLVATSLGTALVAAGAAALNQVDERDLDRLMDRTRHRPVADGRMSPGEARGIAAALSGVGLLLLWAAAGGRLPMIVALATLLSYVAIYTPLKRVSSLATVVGAVPGALPPLIGWAAARGTLAEPAPWALFLIMFLWQLPHFLAIAWMYRADYAQAGMPMLPVVDGDGALTGRQTVLWAGTLLPISQLPYLLGLTNAAYAIGALVLGLLQFVLAVRFAFGRTDGNARALFIGTIAYLPLLWLLMGLMKR
ncbi:MAG TPA: heme o synthase [Vicinamibacterales bacterium]|nr:heme o synthase [Vicinamibacterales bacterium]